MFKIREKVVDGSVEVANGYLSLEFDASQGADEPRGTP
jgi:hypothetical protein